MLNKPCLFGSISLQKCIPIRAIMCVMMFTACWTSYMCRLQMPILAVPMIATHGTVEKLNGACSTDEAAEGGGGGDEPAVRDIKMLFRNPDELLHEIATDEMFSRLKRQDPPPPVEERKLFDLFSNKPYEWSPAIRGQLLAAYAYGNVPGNLMGGIMSIKFGPRQTILWTSLVSALISLVTPLIANIHWCALLISRMIVGLAGGVVFPACHHLVAKWAPPNEKSRFVWSLLGGTFGTIFTYPMIASLAEVVNWEFAWYLPSLLMLIWILIWYFLAYDSPTEHPRISEAEKNFIISAQEGTVNLVKPSLKETPLKQIFTSIPFLCLVICHFGNLFLLFFYQNSMMLYLTKVLGFQLTKGGIIASLPWFARMSFGFFFSWAGDTIKKRKLMSITTLRKVATIFSHFLPGICLIIVAYVGCSFIIANVFLFLALGFNGAASIANLSNNQDLSPNYAGFLYGIMNTVGTISGMLIPPMVEAIAGRHANSIEKWQIVFWIGAAVCIFCMLVFLVGGSGKIQSWNDKNAKPTA